MTVVYTAIATASGRDSHAVSSDGKLDLQLALPPELGGTGAGTNPEQLFAAGYAACFATVMRGVADQLGLDAADAATTAEVGLVRDGSGRFGLEATLRVELPDRLSRAEGEKLVEAAHRLCPYSRAVDGNISVKIVIE